MLAVGHGDSKYAMVCRRFKMNRTFAGGQYALKLRAVGREENARRNCVRRIPLDEHLAVAPGDCSEL